MGLFNTDGHGSKQYNTVNPFYTDTQYNNKICYNDYFKVAKPSLKMWQLMRNYARICIKVSSNKCFGHLLESPH